MGINANHVLGRTQIFYAKAETVAGTFVKPTTTDCLRCENTMMKYEPGRESLNEGSEFADEVERITGKAKCTWQAVCDLTPSTVAANASRLSALLTAALGADNAGAGSTWVYSLTSSQTIPTLTLVRKWSTLLMETMTGAVVEKMTVKLSGNKRSQITFDGAAMGYVLTGTTTLPSAMVTTDQMPTQTADTNFFGISSVVKIGTDDNTGAGYMIKSGTDTPYTLESSISASKDATVVPFAPAPTWLGAPLHGILGAFTVGAVDFPITEFDLTLDKNLSICDDEFGVQTFSDAIPGRRKISGSFACRIRKDLYFRVANRRDFGTVALLATAGTTAGYRFKFSVPQAELGFAEFTASGDKELTMTVPFTGLGTAGTGNDSLVVTTD